MEENKHTRNRRAEKRTKMNCIIESHVNNITNKVEKKVISQYLSKFVSINAKERLI